MQPRGFLHVFRVHPRPCGPEILLYEVQLTARMTSSQQPALEVRKAFGALHLPVSRMRSGCRGTQESGVARSRLSTSVTGSCSAHSDVPGSSASSGGEPSRRGPARARNTFTVPPRCPARASAHPGSSSTSSSESSCNRPAKGLLSHTVARAARLSTRCEPERAQARRSRPTPALRLQATVGHTSFKSCSHTWHKPMEFVGSCSS